MASNWIEHATHQLTRIAPARNMAGWYTPSAEGTLFDDWGREQSYGWIGGSASGRFFNLADLVNQLEQVKAAGKSGRLVETLLRHDLIIIDELGYLPFSQSGAQLLFHLISKLYENTSPAGCT
jgi:hypothetical protein